MTRLAHLCLNLGLEAASAGRDTEPPGCNAKCLWGGVLVAAEVGARSNRGSSELTSGLWRLDPGPGKCLPCPPLLSETSHA